MLYYLLYPLSDSITVFNLLRYITFRSAAAIVTALLISFFFGPYIIKYLKNIKAEQPIRDDNPAGHQKKKGTPTMGGILILISIVIPTLLWARLGNRSIWIVLITTILLGFLGMIDDITKLKYSDSTGIKKRYKFLGQLLIGLALGYYLYSNPLLIAKLWNGSISLSNISQYLSSDWMTQLNIPFLKDVFIDMGILYIPFVALIIIGTSNAVNLTDGLDGLAIGSVLFVALTYTILSYIIGNFKVSSYLNVLFVREAGELTVFCASIIGASLGFLWFNSYPAEIFMGDTGSLALGGALGIVAILIKKEILLIISGGIFVIIALSVILQIATYKLFKRRIFKMAPLHHHFELLGWAEPKIITRFWILASILALLSIATLKLR